MESTEFSIGFSNEKKEKEKKKVYDDFSRAKPKEKTYSIFNRGYEDIKLEIEGKNFEFKKHNFSNISESDFRLLSDNNVFEFYRGTLIVEVKND